MTAAPRGALSLPDIIATAFALVVRQRWRFLVLALPGTILSTGARFLVTYVLQSGTNGKTGGSAEIHLSLGLYGAVLGSWMVAALAAFITDAVIVPAAFDALLGRRVDVRGALAAQPRIAPMLIAGWLIIGGSLVFIIVTSLFLSLAAVITVPVAIFLAVRWSFFIQELCREPSSAALAMRRSMTVVQGRWWRTFAVHLAILLLATLPSLVVLPIEQGVDAPPLNVALAFAAVWVAAPFSAVGRTVLYSDIKLRKGDRVQDRATLGG